MSLESGLIVLSLGAMIYVFLSKLNRIMDVRNLLGKRQQYNKPKEVYIREIITEFILSLIVWIINLISTLSMLTRISVYLFRLNSFVLILVSLEFLVEVIFLMSGQALLGIDSASRQY